MMARVFGKATTTMASAALIVAVFSVVSRLAGFVRDYILLALFYPHGQVLDAYYQALRIPDMLLQLLVIGALSASFIPIFTRYYAADDEKRAWRYTNAVLFALVLAFVVFAVVGAVCAPFLAPLLGVNFPPDVRDTMVDMMRVMFLGQAFFAVSMVFGSVLQGSRRFFLYAFAPIVNNVGIILGAVLLVPKFGPMGLAYGTVLGAVLHALVQFVGAYGVGYRLAFIKFWKDSDVIKTLRHMGPRTVGLAVNQLNFLSMDILASALAAGSVTLLNVSYALNYFPIGVVGVSYAIAAFPTFCERVNAGDRDGFRTQFSETIRQVLFFIIPITVVTLLLRAQIVRALYGSQGFDWDATIIASSTLGFFAMSFFAQAIVYVLVRAYFAFENAVTPLVIGVVGMIINVVAGHMLAVHLGVAGLALGFSIAALVQAALLWVFLRIRAGSLDEARILLSLGIMSVAGLCAAASIQGVKYAVTLYWELDTFWHVAGQAAAATIVGLATYALVAFALRSPEALTIGRGLRRKFVKAAKPMEVTEVV